MNTNMTGLRWFSKVFASLSFGVASSLEGLKIVVTIIIRISHTFEKTLEIRH